MYDRLHCQTSLLIFIIPTDSSFLTKPTSTRGHKFAHSTKHQQGSLRGAILFDLGMTFCYHIRKGVSRIVILTTHTDVKIERNLIKRDISML